MNYITSSSVELFFRNFMINYFVFLNAFYAFIKTKKVNLSKTKTIMAFIINIFASILYVILLSMDRIALSQIISYSAIIISLTLLEQRNRNSSLVISIITTCYAHIIKLISYYLISIIVFIILGPIMNIVPHIISCVFSIFLNFLFMKIKRLKNGILFFEKTENLGLGVFFSGFIFLISLIGFSEIKNESLIVIVAFCTFVSGFGLFLWVRNGITKHYREKLQLKSELYYKEQLEQKEQEIEKLKHGNEYLAKIVHRDNHLMSSLNSSINSYFESDDKEFNDDILREIQTLSNERAELICREQRNSKLLPSTGNILIDGAVNNLYIQAAAYGIDFDLSVSATVDDIIGKYISQTDLQTLICDHIKDAIIAVDAKNENNGKILVELSMENDNYTISIFDSGVDFEIDTLAKLGKERVTTHADNGGSGIGFMTTFETLRKSYASLIITEFEDKTPFSKSVSIRFDGNTAFIIHSYRKEELQSVLTRDDVILL